MFPLPYRDNRRIGFNFFSNRWTRELTNICLCLTYVVVIDKIESHLLLKYQSSIRDRVCYMYMYLYAVSTKRSESMGVLFNFASICELNLLFIGLFFLSITRADCFRIIFAGQVFCISHYESYYFHHVPCHQSDAKRLAPPPPFSLSFSHM